MDVFKQNWLNNIARNGTRVLYKEFKQYFENENYLTELLSKLIIPLAGFRMASHQLLIEFGRLVTHKIGLKEHSVYVPFVTNLMLKVNIIL